MNTNLRTVTDRNDRPIRFFMKEGQSRDHTGAATLLDDLPAAKWLLADRGYDANWFRAGLEEKRIRPCITGRRSGTTPVSYDKSEYRRLDHIEIMFGRLKD